MVSALLVYLAAVKPLAAALPRLFTHLSQGLDLPGSGSRECCKLNFANTYLPDCVQRFSRRRRGRLVLQHRLQDGFCLAKCRIFTPEDGGLWRQEDGPVAAGLLPHPGVDHLPALPLCGLVRPPPDEKQTTC